MTTPTKPQPSPRPWDARPDGDEGAPDNGVRIHDADGYRIGDLYGWRENQANADLVVRAVNHHDELVGALEAFIEWHDVDSTEFKRETAAAKARAVLAKARGES